MLLLSSCIEENEGPILDLLLTNNPSTSTSAIGVRFVLTYDLDPNGFSNGFPNFNEQLGYDVYLRNNTDDVLSNVEMRISSISPTSLDYSNTVREYGILASSVERKSDGYWYKTDTGDYVGNFYIYTQSSSRGSTLQVTYTISYSRNSVQRSATVTQTINLR